MKPLRNGLLAWFLLVLAHPAFADDPPEDPTPPPPPLPGIDDRSYGSSGPGMVYSAVQRFREGAILTATERAAIEEGLKRYRLLEVSGEMVTGNGLTIYGPRVLYSDQNLGVDVSYRHLFGSVSGFYATGLYDLDLGHKRSTLRGARNTAREVIGGIARGTRIDGPTLDGVQRSAETLLSASREHYLASRVSLVGDHLELRHLGSLSSVGVGYSRIFPLHDSFEGGAVRADLTLRAAHLNPRVGDSDTLAQWTAGVRWQDRVAHYRLPAGRLRDGRPRTYGAEVREAYERVDETGLSRGSWRTQVGIEYSDYHRRLTGESVSFFVRYRPDYWRIFDLRLTKGRDDHIYVGLGVTLTIGSRHKAY